MRQTMPQLAEKLAADDWIGPAQKDDWNRLTLGEQQSYRRAACRTMGAVYSISVSGNKVSVAVTLPDTLALRGLTEAKAKSIERFLHNKMEDALVWVLTEQANQQ